MPPESIMAAETAAKSLTEPRDTTVSAAATRGRILRAAGLCFDRHSIRLTTMDEVARLAGVSRQSIYRHFQNKEELVAAVSEQGARRITEAVRRAASHAPDGRSKVVAAIMTCVEQLVTDPQIREMIEIDYRALMMRSARPEIVAAVTDRWTPILQAAMADGALRPDLELDAAISWLTDVQLLLGMRIIALGETLEAVRREVEIFVMDGLTRR
jgi:AcrR family transcriptional regulator